MQQGETAIERFACEYTSQGRDKVKMGDLLNISAEARERLNEQNSVAP